jgi:hypothetical protein
LNWVPPLKPFCALRFAPQRVELASVLNDTGDDPRHVRRLVDFQNPASPTRAALFVAEWCRAGVMAVDPEPSITVVRRSAPDGSADNAALGFFAVVPLAGQAQDPDPARAAHFEIAGIGVEPWVQEGVDESGRMRRTLEGAADREPDASLQSGDALIEAFVIDDETTAARLAAIELTNRKTLAGEASARAQAAWHAALLARTGGHDDAGDRSAGHALAFFVEQRDRWARIPTGLVIASLRGTLSGSGRSALRRHT